MLDHAFGKSDPFTLGVEEEYMLLDAETFDLVQHIDTVLAAVSGHELEPRINPELMQSVLEVATPVCHTPADVAEQLGSCAASSARSRASAACASAPPGTHPFSLFERQRITAKDRYRAMVDRMQYIARRELIFGLHVHVAVDDAEKAIQIVNGLIAHLAELVALSANSPFWRGEPTPYLPDPRLPGRCQAVSRNRRCWGIHALRFGGRDAKEKRIEFVHPRQQGRPLGIALPGGLGIEIEMGRHVPTVRGDFPHGIGPLPQVLPEGADIGCVRKPAGHADDGDVPGLRLPL